MGFTACALQARQIISVEFFLTRSRTSHGFLATLASAYLRAKQ